MDLTSLLSAFSIGMNEVWLLVKLFFLLGLLMYLIYAVVVVRQVDMMIEALGGALGLPVRLMAWTHLVIVIMVLIMAIVIL
jgi:hypothetical protein